MWEYGEFTSIQVLRKLFPGFRMLSFAFVKMIRRYHDNRRGVKLFSKIVFPSRKFKLIMDN